MGYFLGVNVTNTTSRCPLSIPGSSDISQARRQSFFYNGPFCYSQESRMRLKLSFSSSTASSTTPPHAVDMFFFSTRQGWLEFVNGGLVEERFSLNFQTCMNGRTFISNTTYLGLAIMCLSDEDPCLVNFKLEWSCVFTTTSVIALGIVGIVLCGIVTIMCAGFYVYACMKRSFLARVDLLMMLLGITAISCVNLVSWICFLVDTLNEEIWSNRALLTTIWICDKMELLLSAVVLLLLLYSFVSSYHNPTTRVASAVFNCLAAFLFSAFVSLVCAQKVVPSSTIPATMFYCMFYVVLLGVSIALVVYSSLLLKDVDDVQTRGVVAGVLIVTGLVLCANLGRVITGSIGWLSSLKRDQSLPPDQLVKFVSFPGLAVWFPSFNFAVAFYVFVFLVPDTIPNLGLLTVLFFSIQRSLKKDRGNQLSEALVDSTDDTGSSGYDMRRYDH